MTRWQRRGLALFPFMLGLLLVEPAVAGGFSDTSLGYRYGPDFREPGVTDSQGRAADISKNIFNLTHVDASTYGSNFLSVDWQLSDSADPKKNSTEGAQELYLIYRHSFTISAWTERKYGFGPVDDTTLVAGFDLNRKNTAYDPRKRMLVLGPEFEFGVPAGFLKTAVLLEKEYDHNGIVGRSENFDLTWAVESSWTLPYQVGSLPAQFEGYLNFYGPKGRDDFGNETKTETLFHPRVMFDLGALAGHAKIVWAGIGYEFWYNKFGADHSITQGALQNTVLAELAVHFW